MSSKHCAAPRFTAVALCGFFLFLAYAPAWRGQFVWDDFAHVYSNSALRRWDGLLWIWSTPGSVPQYYPLTFTFFWIEYHLWHLHPLGYHLVNIAMHGANALLFGSVLQRLRVPGAWLAAALFVFHPVHVESVAWISELKNVGSTFFYLASLWAALKGGFLAHETPLDGPAWIWYGASFVLFMCALLSKTTACVLPVVFILLIFWKRGRPTLDDGLRLLPFFVAGFFYGCQAAVLEKVSIGAEGAEWSFSFLQRVLIASRALCFYAAKLIIPYPLIFAYPRWSIDATNGALYVYPLALLSVLAVLWRRRDDWGIRPLIAVGFFFINLFLALGFVNFYPMRYSFVADHFQYVASMGLIALFSGALVQKFSPRWQPLPPALRLTVLVLCFGNLWMSVRREAWKFRNLDALWQDTLAKNPSAALAHNDLAALAIARGDWASAPMHLQQALTLQPALAQAHYNEGRLLQHNGRLPEAVVEFSRAVLLESQQPDYQNALAAAWLLEGKTKAARAVVENALRLWPDDAKLHTTKDALSKS